MLALCRDLLTGNGSFFHTNTARGITISNNRCPERMRRWSLLAQDLKVALSDRFLGLTRLSPRRPLHRQCNGRRLFNDSDSSIEPAEARFLTKCSYPRHRNTTLQATCSAFIQRYKDSVSSDLDNENDNLELYGVYVYSF